MITTFVLSSFFCFSAFSLPGIGVTKLYSLHYSAMAVSYLFCLLCPVIQHLSTSVLILLYFCCHSFQPPGSPYHNLLFLIGYSTTYTGIQHYLPEPRLSGTCLEESNGAHLPKSCRNKKNTIIVSGSVFSNVARYAVI